MNCPICNGILIPQDRKNLYVAEECESSTENFSGEGVIYYYCTNGHSVYLQDNEVTPNPDK